MRRQDAALAARSGDRPAGGWRTVPGGPTAPISRDWWTLFGDPVLTRLVTTALAHNDDIAIAAARVREARAQEQTARAALVPNLEAGVAASVSRTVSPFGTGLNQVEVAPVFQSSYELDLFGRVREQISAARSAWLASAAARDAAALSVAAATASGYITLRGLDARLAVLRATLTSRAEELRLARSRAAVGYTSDLELRQAEAEYESTAQAIPPAQLAITREEDALSLLLGYSPRAVERGADIAALHAPPVPAELPSELLRRRPDVVQAEFTLAASDANLAVARAQFMPRINLAASTGTALSTVLANPITLWSIGASILAPIFEGGRLRAGVNTAAARRDEAAFTYRRTVLTAFREVEDNLAAVQRLREQRGALEAQRTATAEALRHAINRYQAGYSSYLEQLDAQRALLTVDLSLVQARVDTLNALVGLYQAMGGGWTTASLPRQ